jgi:hypothetical protein
MDFFLFFKFLIQTKSLKRKHRQEGVHAKIYVRKEILLHTGQQMEQGRFFHKQAK